MNAKRIVLFVLLVAVAAGIVFAKSMVPPVSQDGVTVTFHYNSRGSYFSVRNNNPYSISIKINYETKISTRSRSNPHIVERQAVRSSRSPVSIPCPDHDVKSFKITVARATR